MPVKLIFTHSLLDKETATNNFGMDVQTHIEDRNDRISDQVLSYSRKNNSSKPNNSNKPVSENNHLDQFQNRNVEKNNWENSKFNAKILLKKCNLKLMKLSTEEIQNWSQMKQNNKTYEKILPI